jgi:hypothetical protein
MQHNPPVRVRDAPDSVCLLPAPLAAYAATAAALAALAAHSLHL